MNCRNCGYILFGEPYCKECGYARDYKPAICGEECCARCAGYAALAEKWERRGASCDNDEGASEEDQREAATWEKAAIELRAEMAAPHTVAHQRPPTTDSQTTKDPGHV